MKVLIACEESQEVCKAFRAKGHEAYSCDIQMCSGGHPEWHICNDVLDIINGNTDFFTCDGAENKSVEDYRAYGLLARGAEKGPNSREYSYKWLQSLRSIVIDNKRCPVACEEFINCEYDRDKEGNVISGYPDGNDHVIDAVRYAMERVWKRRGQ